MFGFSISKLILTLLLIVAVIYCKRLIGGIGNRSKSVRGGGGSARPVGEDTQQCSVCGVYVSALDPSSCGRSDCPYKS